MHFGSSIRGSRPYWNKRCSELKTLIHQLGPPSSFFTLSAADTKWPDLQQLFIGETSPRTLSNKERLENVVNNPHITSLYLHKRFEIFQEEVLQKLLGAKDYWYRTEWQSRGTGHIHGFIWLPNAPNVDKLNWNDHSEIDKARAFFDAYVTAWNPREANERNNIVYRLTYDDPCLLDTAEIFSIDPSDDYEELVNRVQRHTKCSEATCLRNKGTIMLCCYKAPWNEQSSSTLASDSIGNKKYEPAWNDDRLNIHNQLMLQIWRANIDWQPVISRELVLKYIAKYAAKAERTSETCTKMLSRICATRARQSSSNNIQEIHDRDNC